MSANPHTLRRQRRRDTIRRRARVALRDWRAQLAEAREKEPFRLTTRSAV